MKKLTILAVGLLLLVPSLAFSDSFSLRLGYFMPRASTDILAHPDSLWAIEFDQMSYKMKDYRGAIYGASYEHFLGKNISLVITLDSFSKSHMGDYLYYDQTEFTDSWFAFPISSEPSVITDWFYISLSFKVTSTPLQVSFKFLPLGRRSRLIPFVGGGGGLYFWSVRMYGEMIDFYPLDDSNQHFDWYYDYETDSAYANPTDEALRDQLIFPVESVNGQERGMAFGWHAFAGLQFPIGDRATIEAEARYHSAQARLKDWFQGFDNFDLGGLALTVGLSYWF